MTREASTMRSPCLATKSHPRTLQQGKALLQQQRVSTTKNEWFFNSLHQEQRKFIPRQNIFIEESGKYIPQQKVNQREDVYQKERSKFSRQSNINNQNYMNFPPGYCPIHGMQGLRFDQMQQQFYNTHEEIEEITGETNNYRFYESKNIKNKKDDSNSITLHYTRGGMKRK